MDHWLARLIIYLARPASKFFSDYITHHTTSSVYNTKYHTLLYHQNTTQYVHQRLCPFINVKRTTTEIR